MSKKSDEKRERKARMQAAQKARTIQPMTESEEAEWITKMITLADANGGDLPNGAL